ncbi:MAG: aminotransferase class III-fold pyridoxal phosphate-dependent enzyme [Candidatus Thorarchaeota archaeon]|nr:aminotransferase class III-fold pyridoxal phosphate-dependent enzyme [Candidatus Thorarchaeota archaeon]
MSQKDGARPEFSAEDATHIVLELYGLKTTAEELPSERDRNYLLKKDEVPAYILKIAATSEKRETLEFQNAAMNHLAEMDLPFLSPLIIPSTTGDEISLVPDSEGDVHFVRLLTYLPGLPLAKVNPHTPELLKDFGMIMGSLSKALEIFDHPATHRDFYWDLKNSSGLIAEYRGLIVEDETRALVDHFNELFSEKVVPKIRGLRTSVNHNDGNDYNVLVGNGWSNELRQFGLLDFGDMVHTCTVFELAIATAYAILDKPDPLSAAASVISGYHQQFPLMDEEIELLFPMICQRLITSICIQVYQLSEEPDNEYLAISAVPVLDTLKRLRPIHPNRAWYQFREACGFSPHPNNDKVTAWLNQNQKLFFPLLGSNFDYSNTSIIDLSVGSKDYGAPEEVSNPEKFIALIESKLLQEKSNLGLGRYNEARMIYAASQYSPKEMSESRTVHIALDFFIRSDTPIFAPLDGVVHSIKNNDLPFDNGPTIVLEHRTGDGTPFYTLYGHLSLESIEEIEIGQTIVWGQEIGRIGEYPVNGGWPSHLHFQVILDMLDFEGDYFGVCWPSQRNLWTSICPDPNLIIGFSPSIFPPKKMSAEKILELRRKHFGRNLSVSYETPIKMVRGYMQHLYDEDGRQYLDCVNNVPHVGHSHPKVVKALHDQAKALYTNTRYLHDNLALYAQKLAATLPDPLSVCFFVNSGSEANELAIRLAKAHTGRDGFIALTGAYHGNTDNLVGLSAYKHAGEGGSGPPDNVIVVIDPDPYRSVYGKDEKAAMKHADDVKTGIEWIADRGHPVAAFICEPVMSCAGQIVFPPKYLQYVYKYIREAGGVCIADEVQIGFGRMGTHFWGFETQGVIPDIVTLGKPIGNGHPLAAVVTTAEIAESFNNGMEFFSTTGGNTVSCAVGLAVLDVIESEGLQENARVVGEYLKLELEKLQKKHPLIGDVRGYGLFLGVELTKPGDIHTEAPEEAKYIVNRMRDLGVIMSVDGSMRNVLKIKPPIIFSKDDADQLVTTLDLVLSEDFPRIAHQLS